MRTVGDYVLGGALPRMKFAHPARRTACAALGLACAAALLFIAAGRGAAAAPALQPGADPLDSSRWDDMRRVFFGDAPVVFDDRVAVTAPFSAEDPLNVPVHNDATSRWVRCARCWCSLTSIPSSRRCGWNRWLRWPPSACA
ncbi:hypothetical protein [Thauera humireducens]|uniref:hypothetical protein n=1 Tax=Thauera humireducens TaxID=1134435 RepID=UPI00311DB241